MSGKQSKDSGIRFKQMRICLGANQSDFAKVFSVSWYKTIRDWEADEPKLTEENITMMIKLGLNPLFFYGCGEMSLNNEPWNVIQNRFETYVTNLKKQKEDNFSDEEGSNESKGIE